MISYSSPIEAFHMFISIVSLSKYSHSKIPCPDFPARFESTCCHSPFAHDFDGRLSTYGGWGGGVRDGAVWLVEGRANRLRAKYSCPDDVRV